MKIDDVSKWPQLYFHKISKKWNIYILFNNYFNINVPQFFYFVSFVAYFFYLIFQDKLKRKIFQHMPYKNIKNINYEHF